MSKENKRKVGRGLALFLVVVFLVFLAWIFFDVYIVNNMPPAANGNAVIHAPLPFMQWLNMAGIVAFGVVCLLIGLVPLVVVVILAWMGVRWYEAREYRHGGRQRGEQPQVVVVQSPPTMPYQPYSPQQLDQQPQLMWGQRQPRQFDVIGSGDES